MMGLVPLQEETSDSFLSLLAMWGHSKKASQQVFSPKPDCAGTLISDFQPPERWENKFLLFKPPSLWYFVMAAQAD